MTGNRNCSRRLLSVDLRHASSGPMPVSTSIVRPIGIIHGLKNGGADCDAPARRQIASLIVGNIVANSTKNAENSRIQLLSMNAASRDTQESSSLRARSSGSR